MLRTWAVVLVVAAVGVAATVDGIRSDGNRAPDTPAATDTTEADTGERIFAGADAPPAGGLPGALAVVTRQSCRLRLIGLDERRLGDVGPRTACGVWPSPTGVYGATTTVGDDGRPSPWARLALVRLDDRLDVVRSLGPIEGEPTWSPDGTELAWCTPSGETVRHTAATGTEREVAGCKPQFAADGSLLTTPPEAFSGALLRDGAPLLGPLDLARGFDPASTGDLDVLAFDESSEGLLAVSVLRLDPTGSRAVLELWRAGSFVAAIPLPSTFGPGPNRFGAYLRFNPPGTSLAIGPAARDASMTFVDLRLRRPVLELGHQHAFSWSPDGSWLAVATDDAIAFYSANGPEPVYRLPVRAAALGWVPAPADA